MRYNNLQVGRIVAATAVLTFHAAFYGELMLKIPSVFSGVAAAYVFRTTVVFLFALSGFILAHCLQTATLGSFVSNRLLRLFPAYWFALFAVLLSRKLIGHPIVYPPGLLPTAVVLWPAGPGKVMYALGVEWTLVYEFFLSMAIVPLAMCGRRWGLGIGAGIWLALCLGRQIVFGGNDVPWFPNKAEIILSIVNVPFLLGVLIYLVHGEWMNKRWIPFAAAIALAAGFPFVESANPWSYVLQTVGCALAVGYFACNKQLGNKNYFVTSGNWAYGVYLVHVPVVWTIFSAILVFKLPATSQGVVLVAGLITLAIGVIYGMFEWGCYQRYRAFISAKRTMKPAAAVAVDPQPGLKRAA